MQGVANLHELLPRRRSALTRFITVALLGTSMVLLMMSAGVRRRRTTPVPVAKPRPASPLTRWASSRVNSTNCRAERGEVLAARLSVGTDSLTLIKDEAVQWSDASLGCPQEGMMYAQMITPGHRMTFRHNEDTYEVHTADAGSSMEPVSCEGGVSYDHGRHRAPPWTARRWKFVAA